MFQDNDVAIAAHLSREFHHTALHRDDGRSNRNGEVDAAVNVGSQSEETQTIGRGERRIDRPPWQSAGGRKQAHGNQ